MNPVLHARSSSSKHGGHWRDFVALHTWFDQSKAAFASVQHRVFLHTDDLGRDICRRVHGDVLRLSDGREVKMDFLIDQHLREDVGFRARLDDYLAFLDPSALRDRSGARQRTSRFISAPLEAAAVEWGGEPGDYAPVLEILDLAARHSSHPAAHHVLYNSLGIFLAEQAVGPAIETRDGHIIPTRIVAERFVEARTGQIRPSAVIPKSIDIDPWMASALVRAAKTIWPEALEGHDHEEGHDEADDPEMSGAEAVAADHARGARSLRVGASPSIHRAIGRGAHAATLRVIGDLRPGDVVEIESWTFGEGGVSRHEGAQTYRRRVKAVTTAPRHLEPSVEGMPVHYHALLSPETC